MPFVRTPSLSSLRSVSRQAGPVLATALLTLFSALAGIRPVHAEWIPRVSTHAASNSHGGTLLINDRPILHLSLPLRDDSASDRLNSVSARLKRHFQANPDSLEVRVQSHRSGREADVVLNGVVLVTASRRDARANDTEPVALARQWAARIREASALPGLEMPVHQILVPLGETRKVSLKGVARGPIQVTRQSPTPESDPGFDAGISGGVLHLKGINPGAGKVILEREGAHASIAVVVQPYAAQISTIAPIPTTAGFDDDATRFRLAAAHVREAVHPLPGATVEIQQDEDASASRKRFVPVSLRVHGAGMIPISTKIPVPVASVAPPRLSSPAAILLYSNEPERLTRIQTLFTGTMAPPQSGPTRLLYHHQSFLPSDATFVVELENPGQNPARVLVMGGIAGPVRDTVWVGYRAAKDYMDARQGHSGYYLDIPAHSAVTAIQTRLPAGQTISGLQDLISVAGEPLKVRIRVCNPAEAVAQRPAFVPEPTTDSTPAPTPTPAIASQDQYPNPHMTLQASYAVGGSWSFVPLGAASKAVATASLPSGESEHLLAGHYGFVYDVEWTITNPTAQTAKARIVFEPSAGLAGGVFLVSGAGSKPEMVTIPQAREDQEIELAKVQLAPGEKRIVHVRTVPLAGSNYPARLILRP